MSESFRIADGNKIAEILGIFSGSDSVRWSSAANYNLINYCADDLTPDEELLTHWLCYVTDRQTTFERVWEVGGYVISHMVRAFMRDEKTPTWIFATCLKRGPKARTLQFQCDLLNGPNKRLAFYGVKKSPVVFASRYIPSDALAVLRTLYLLD